MGEVRAELQRQGYTEFGTLGRWTIFDGDLVAFTCLAAENPDRGNVPGVSCIPEGEYKLVRRHYNHGGYPAFQVLMADGSEIPGRTHVLVHIGNDATDVRGCVVLGARPVATHDHWGVGPSGTDRGGFTNFMKTMDRLGVDECPLSIFYRKG
jgi:hypothetical protein